jgi:hypothetical protein
MIQSLLYCQVAADELDPAANPEVQVKPATAGGVRKGHQRRLLQLKGDGNLMMLKQHQTQQRQVQLPPQRVNSLAGLRKGDALNSEERAVEAYLREWYELCSAAYLRISYISIHRFTSLRALEKQFPERVMLLPLSIDTLLWAQARSGFGC